MGKKKMSIHLLSRH